MAVEKHAATGKGSYYRWVVVASTFSLLFVLYGTNNAFGVFFKPLLEEFNWTRAQVSGAAAIYMVVHGLLAVAAAVLSDRYGPKKVVAVGAIFSGLAYVLVSTTNSLWQLYVYWGLVLSLGMSTVWSPITSTVARWFHEKRGLALGIVTSGVGAGMMAAPPLAAEGIIRFGWRTSFLALGIVVWVFAISLSLLLKPPSKEQEDRAANNWTQKASTAKTKTPPSPAAGNPSLSPREAISTLYFWLMFVVSGLEAIAHQTILVHIVPHASDVGLAATTAALVLTTIGAGNVLGRIVIGYASDRAGSKATLLVCFAVQGVMLLWLMIARSPWMFILFAIPFGMSYAATMPMFVKLAAENFGLKSTGTIIATWLLAFALGGGIGAPLAGYVFDTTGSYSIAFVTAAAAMFMAFILTAFARSPRKSSN